MQAEFDAARIAEDLTTAAAVTALAMDPDWLVTPEGAMSLSAEPSERPAAGPRVVRFDHGALALLGPTS